MASEQRQERVRSGRDVRTASLLNSPDDGGVPSSSRTRARRRASRCSNRVVLWTILICLASLSRAGPGLAQGARFGGQARADAASNAIVLAIQQGISALPPTAGESIVYEFDRKLDVPVRSEQLGPTSLRTPETVGEGNLSIRGAASYFDLPATLGPIDYRLDFDDPTVSPPQFTKFGTKIDAKVGVFDLTLNYGITRDIEANLNLPIVLVDAHAWQIYSADPADGSIALRDTIPEMNQAIANHEVVLRTLSFSQLRADFNDGTHVGVGRISVGTKALVYSRDPFRLAAACDFYVPSPNQNQFSGSDSPSILPRLIGAARLTDWLRLHLDAGYDYDFDVSELRRFVWDAGVSFPLAVGTFDLGVGGSKYDTPIEWTPSHARASIFPGDPSDISVTAVGDNQTGTNYVDFLAGAKVRVSDAVIVSGAVNVPVTDAGLQPIVGGTVALEYYF